VFSVSKTPEPSVSGQLLGFAGLYKVARATLVQGGLLGGCDVPVLERAPLVPGRSATDRKHHEIVHVRFLVTCTCRSSFVAIALSLLFPSYYRWFYHQGVNFWGVANSQCHLIRQKQLQYGISSGHSPATCKMPFPCRHFDSIQGTYTELRRHEMRKKHLKK
jgi:hypothetical protein